MTRRSAGFSLLEIMISLIIMIILMTDIPDMWHEVKGSQRVRALSDARMLSDALWGPTLDSNGFVTDIGRLPTQLTNITWNLTNELVVPPLGSATFAYRRSYLGVTGGWNGPYAGFPLDAVSNDPWGNPWQITAEGQVQSWGPDGLPNNTDDLYAPAHGYMPNGQFYGGVSVIVYDETGQFPMDKDHVKVMAWNSSPATTPAGDLIHTVPIQLTYSNVHQRFEAAFTANSGLTPGVHVIEAMALPPTVTPWDPLLKTNAGTTWNSANSTWNQMPGCDTAATNVVATASNPTAVSGQCLHGHARAVVVGGSYAAVEIRLR